MRGANRNIKKVTFTSKYCHILCLNPHKIEDIRQNAKKKIFFCGFEPAKMHCEFTYTTNAFQDES